MGLLARVGQIMEQLGQIQWKYSDPARRIRSNVVSATEHLYRFRGGLIVRMDIQSVEAFLKSFLCQTNLHQKSNCSVPPTRLSTRATLMPPWPS